MRGRKKKPTAIKKAEGTIRKDRILPNEMLPAQFDGIPEIYEKLKKNKMASEIWNEKICEYSKMNMVHKISFDVLAAYCLTTARYFKVTEECERDGYVDDGGKRKSIDIVRRDLLNQVIKLASELGFTPASWTKISMPEKPKGNNLFDE